MKTVLLMRHAKSDPGEPGVEDFERPLGSRGLDDAPRMGRALAKAGCVPDLIVASPARRAKQTAELVAKASGFEAEISWEPALYEATGSAWIDVLRRLSDKAGTVLLVAHSPGAGEAAALLLGGGGRTRLVFPTGAIACIGSHADRWKNIGGGHGELRWLLIPRLLKAIA